MTETGITWKTESWGGKDLDEEALHAALRAAFNYSKMPWTVYDVDGGYGVAHYAEYGFNNHHGNCYVMAGTFVTLARNLDTRLIRFLVLFQVSTEG